MTSSHSPRLLGQKQNKFLLTVCLCALKSVGREHLKRFFEADIHAIIHRAVEQIGARVLKKRTWIS